MAHDVNNVYERVALGLAIGVITGVALGVSVVVLFPRSAGARLRHQVRARAQRLTRDATALSRSISQAASGLTEEGFAFATRVRTAARAGMREARRHFCAVRDPRRSDLTGVEGLAEGF